jgi:hypothetical protein
MVRADVIHTTSFQRIIHWRRHLCLGVHCLRPQIPHSLRTNNPQPIARLYRLAHLLASYQYRPCRPDSTITGMDYTPGPGDLSYFMGENPQFEYTLTIYTPPRPPPSYLPAFLFRDNNPAPRTFVIRERLEKPNYDYFEERHLDDMETKTIKILARDFPPQMRCRHVREPDNKSSFRGCKEGCYFLEKGGEKVRRFRCKRPECEGHVYCGKVKKIEEGVMCFGEKGKRLVCLDMSVDQSYVDSYSY